MDGREGLPAASCKREDATSSVGLPRGKAARLMGFQRAPTRVSTRHRRRSEEEAFKTVLPIGVCSAHEFVACDVGKRSNRKCWIPIRPERREILLFGPYAL